MGVVIVSWNVRELLRRCLTAIRQTAPHARIVVVDNASADGSVGAVRKEFPDVAVIANESNRGFTRANNQGLKLLGVGEESERPPRYVALLNPDTEVRGAALDLLCGYLDLNGRVGAAGPRLEYPDGRAQGSARRFPTLLSGLVESAPVEWHWPGNPISSRLQMANEQPEAAGRVDWVTGAAMVLRVEALRQVGLFDEAFFMYSEELDLCRRLWSCGWEVHFLPEALVVHHEGASSSQVVPERHRRFQSSRVRYFVKHHGAIAGTLVKLGLCAQYAGEMLLEGTKWLVGHKRELRTERMGAYAGIMRHLLLGDSK